MMKLEVLIEWYPVCFFGEGVVEGSSFPIVSFPTPLFLCHVFLIFLGKNLP